MANRQTQRIVSSGVVSLCGEEGLLLVHALHFSAEFIHDSTLFSTCHNRRNPGSVTCHSELQPYLDAYSAVLKQDVSERKAAWAICQRRVFLYTHPPLSLKKIETFENENTQTAMLC